MRYHSYLNSAKKIIESYPGEVPFADFIKKYFSANKKFGGRDRKQITSLCYNFYRVGRAIPQLTVEEKIIVATFLCENSSIDFLHFHKPEWNTIIAKPVTEKLKITGVAIEHIFPWARELSAGVDVEPFCYSFFHQPDLFLRIRPGKKETTLKKLGDAGITYELFNGDCISLPNSTKVDSVLEINNEVIIQDRNSQQVLNFFKVAGAELPGFFSNMQTPVSVWDCCAASGGKSILAYDILQGQIDLTVSDIRESILRNLKNRFSAAGIVNYNSFIANLAIEPGPVITGRFQLIICDVPCTGSGTWSRTPEQVYYFEEKLIDVYTERQRKIVSNTISCVQEGGVFIYITCSVFKQENEAMVNYIKGKFNMHLVRMELLNGYDKKADSMFTAVFIKK